MMSQKTKKRRVAQAINGIAKLSDIKYAAIKSQTGVVDYHVGTGIVVSHTAGNAQPNQDLSPFDAVYLGTYRAREPVIAEGRKIADLDLIIDLSDLRSALATSFLQAAGTGLVAALIGMLLSWYFQNRISAPVTNLRALMQRVQSEHDYELRAKRTTDDETGQLTDAFNNMLDEIQRRDQKLARHRQDLEKAVIERTSDLAAAKKNRRAGQCCKV